MELIATSDGTREVRRGTVAILIIPPGVVVAPEVWAYLIEAETERGNHDAEREVESLRLSIA